MKPDFLSEAKLDLIISFSDTHVQTIYLVFQASLHCEVNCSENKLNALTFLAVTYHSDRPDLYLSLFALHTGHSHTCCPKYQGISLPPVFVGCFLCVFAVLPRAMFYGDGEMCCMAGFENSQIFLHEICLIWKLEQRMKVKHTVHGHWIKKLYLASGGMNVGKHKQYHRDLDLHFCDSYLPVT